MELALAGENNIGHKLTEGIRGLQRELDLEDDTFLKSVVKIQEYNENDNILVEGSHSDVALGYVIEGELTMYQSDNEKMDRMYSAERGECFGQLAMLTGEANFYTCKATKPTIVALLSKSSFFSIVSETPEMVLSLAHSTIKRLSPLVRKIDFALDWLTVEAGRAVNASAQGNTLLVLSGRLRSYTVERSGSKQLYGEYGRGEMVGLVDAITGVKLKKTYLSTRDSEICVIPSQLLEFLKTRSMVVMTKLINILGNRLMSGHYMSGNKADQVDETPNVKYHSVAIFANKTSVPILPFCFELENALSANGPVARLSSKIIKTKLGQTALDGGHDYRLNSWLDQQEDRHSCVIYQCDATVTEWTKKCLRHADLVLVLASAGEGAEVTNTEKDFESLARRIRKELVLLWDQETEYPSGTREWLKKRAWLSGHIHVKMPNRMTKYKTEGRIMKQYAALSQSDPDIHSDFSRISRALLGKSLGLVLGGGGARGAAHLGMLKSIVEAGIPIDKVGGTSIGAFMSGLWALHRDIDTVSEKSENWFHWMTQPINLLDLTYPITSLFSGKYFNNSIKTTFPETINIEDLWLPFYSVSTNINTSTERVHRTGTLWRYVRASMTYSWIIPPICDPVDGHMLMDGCYVNNVPGDIMLKSSCSHIIVVDVTSPDDTELTNYGDSLSGWWMLWKRWNPFTSPVKIPTQEGIQDRLAFCSHYKNLDALKNNPHYEYIQPPVGHFSSSKFALFKEIQRVGYHHGTTFFCGLKKADKSSDNLSRHAGAWLPTSNRAKLMGRVGSTRRNSGNYSFTDLAQMVVSGVKVGREWQGKKLKDSPEASLQDQDSDDTGIMI
jgi:lysophospholipid hydrolase